MSLTEQELKLKENWRGIFFTMSLILRVSNRQQWQIVFPFPWQRVQRFPVRTSVSIYLSRQRNQKTVIVVVLAVLRVCLTFMRKKCQNGEKNARELNLGKMLMNLRNWLKAYWATQSFGPLNLSLLQFRQVIRASTGFIYQRTSHLG